MLIYKRAFATILATTLIFLTACGVSNDDDPQIAPDMPYQISNEEHLPDSEIAGEEHLQDDEEIASISLEQRISNFKETRADNIRGLAISIFTRDEIILEIEYGYADTAAGLAVDSDTVFAWASVTKPLVWVSVMQLYERGELDLHADIFTYISRECFPHIIYPTTMYHLMHHTAGFYYNNATYTTLINIEVGEAMPTLGNSLRDVSSSGIIIQNSRPGERISYSNYGSVLAGYIVQQIAGVPFHEYVHSNIFAPLSMYHTALLPDLSDNEWVMQQREKIKLYDPWGLLFTQQILLAHYPGGAAVGTISDMIKFARALLPDENGGSILFENAETLSKLHPSLEDILNAPSAGFSGEAIAFINGFETFPDRSREAMFPRIIGHAGSLPGFITLMYIDIDSGVGMIMSENTRHGLSTAPGFLTFFTHEIPELVSGI